MRKGVKTVIILAVVLALIGGAWAAARKWILPRMDGGDDDAVIYVDTVASYMGIGQSGMLNRFAGVVESQETWSCKTNPSYTVKEVFVSVGDEVKVGDPLFEYDITQFESDLQQADIDMERLQNEYEVMVAAKEQLEKDAKKAKASEQAAYTIQIKEQELNIRQKEIDIQSKQLEIDKLKENMEHSTVFSELEGVIKTVNNGTEMNMGMGNDDSFITVMKIGDLRVKGTVNEQNIGEIMPGSRMAVHSRVDDSVWYGTVDRIDTENGSSQQQNYYGEGGGNGSTSYPFYVMLDDSEGLMLGQHVYMELDLGLIDEEPEDDGKLYLYEYMIDMTDPEKPFVWASKDGRLEKRTVGLGAYDEEMMRWEITEGLTLEDLITMPMEGLEEGMKTTTVPEEATGVPSDGEMEDGMMYEDGGMYEDGMYEEGMEVEEGAYEEGAYEEGALEEEAPSQAAGGVG